MSHLRCLSEAEGDTNTREDPNLLLCDKADEQNRSVGFLAIKIGKILRKLFALEQGQRQLLCCCRKLLVASPLACGLAFLHKRTFLTSTPQTAVQIPSKKQLRRRRRVHLVLTPSSPLTFAMPPSPVSYLTEPPDLSAVSYCLQRTLKREFWRPGSIPRTLLSTAS